MSFPRLVLEGTASLRTITAIKIEYDNDTLTDKPTRLTRSRYDVKRQYRNKAASAGTKLINPQVVYDQFRLIHSWVGYIDVLTESVAIHAGSSAGDSLTVALIKSAVVLEMSGGVQHTIKSFTSGDLGPDEATLDGTYTVASEQGLDWVYGVENTADPEDPPVYVDETSIYWVIQDINIADMGNNTSRVTFSLQFIEKWESLADVLDPPA